MLIQKVSVKAVLTDACQSGRHMGVDFRLKFHHCTSPFYLFIYTGFRPGGAKPWGEIKCHFFRKRFF